MTRSAATVLVCLPVVTFWACGRGGTTSATAAAEPRGGQPPVAAPAGSGRALSVDGEDACALVTTDDVRRISGYANMVVQPGTSEGRCLRRTSDDRFSLIVSVGQYVDLRGSLGGTHVELERGLTGYENSTGWITAVVYPDGTAVNLGLSGTAISNESKQAGYRLALADGRVVDVASQYRAYAEAVVANSR